MKIKFAPPISRKACHAMLNEINSLDTDSAQAWKIHQNAGNNRDEASKYFAGGGAVFSLAVFMPVVNPHVSPWIILTSFAAGLSVMTVAGVREERWKRVQNKAAEKIPLLSWRTPSDALDDRVRAMLKSLKP